MICSNNVILQLVEIQGKRNRKVPVLLTSDMCKALDILVHTRAAVGVPDSNSYLFAAPSTTSGHLKGWDSISCMVKKAGLSNPELVTATNLRKYIATVSQVVDLDSKNELEWLANHMGHTLSVHRQYYRLQEHTLELAKVSKLLIAVDGGNYHKYAGKSLDKITLEEINVDTVDSDSETDEIEEEFTSQLEVKNREDFKQVQDLSDKKKSMKECEGKKKKERRAWAEEDKMLLRKMFHQSFTLKRPPSKSDIMLQGRKCQRMNKLIEERGWQSVKFYVWNLVQQVEKKTRKLLNDK